MTDEPTLAQLGARRAVLLGDLERLTERIRPAALAAHAEGLSESETARVAHVDRETLRKWLGKARQRRRSA